MIIPQSPSFVNNEDTLEAFSLHLKTSSFIYNRIFKTLNNENNIFEYFYCDYIYFYYNFFKRQSNPLPWIGSLPQVLPVVRIITNPQPFY